MGLAVFGGYLGGGLSRTCLFYDCKAMMRLKKMEHIPSTLELGCYFGSRMGTKRGAAYSQSKPVM